MGDYAGLQVWRIWRRKKYPAPTGIQTPNRKAHSQVATPTTLSRSLTIVTIYKQKCNNDLSTYRLASFDLTPEPLLPFDASTFQ